MKIGNTRKQVKDEVKKDREREGKDAISVKTDSFTIKNGHN